MTTQLPEPRVSRAKRHLFISYSHKDLDFVMDLLRHLDRRGMPVWVDDIQRRYGGIAVGSDWQQKLADAIQRSAAVLLIITPDSAVSKHVYDEIALAARLRKPIIPLMHRPISRKEPLGDTRLARIMVNGQPLGRLHYLKFTEDVDFKVEIDKLMEDLVNEHDAATVVGVPRYRNRLLEDLQATSREGAEWVHHFIQEQALPVTARHYSESQQSENLLAAMRRHKRLVVLGEPGSGKSVSLQRLAWDLLQDDQPAVPVIVRLNTYSGNLMDDISTALGGANGPFRLTGPNSVARLLSEITYTCYLLLDGLNEVEPRYRDDVLADIRRLTAEYRRHPVIVTSRFHDGDRWGTLRDQSDLKTTLLIEPITEDDALQYLQAHLGEDEKTQLWDQLRADQMRGLVTRPLLLWMLKETWKQARARGDEPRLPSNRGALYRRFIKDMLQRDQRSGLLRRGIKMRVRRDKLTALAWEFQVARTTQMSRPDVDRLVGNARIVEVLLENGLLIDIDGKIAFGPHQTFQEHFAARALANKIKEEAQAWRLLPGVRTRPAVLKYAEEDWWAETFIQLAGLIPDPDRLVLLIAERKPWLAWWCTLEGGTVKDGTLRRVEQLTVKLVDSPRVVERRRAVDALSGIVNRRATGPLSLLSIDDDTQTARAALAALLHQMPEDGQAAYDDVMDMHFAARTPAERMRWGRRIAEGDPRPGAGLRTDQRPNVAWGRPVPAGDYGIGGDPKATGMVAARRVRVPYEFEMGRFPVTRVQIMAFLQAGDFERDTWWRGLNTDPRQERQSLRWRLSAGTNNFPAVFPLRLSLAFARWLTFHYRHTGALGDDMELRLPYELEWEIAARYPNGQYFPWGNTYRLGCINADETRSGGGSGPGQLAPVGVYPQGRNKTTDLYDLCGNTWEWCYTCLHTRQGRFTVRGGSYLDEVNQCRPAAVPARWPYQKGPVGLRLVRVPLDTRPTLLD